MEIFMEIVGFIAVIALLFYLAYLNGFLSINAKFATLFMESWVKGKNGSRARMIGCKGYIKRVIKFKENREYRFELQVGLLKGTMSVEIQNRQKETVLELDPAVPEAVLEMKKGERYYLILRFADAEGDYIFTWE
jgi:hypothetical protein